jgi:hypothetical protein
VTDPDELIQLLAMLIEDARDAVAAERALAGAVRLSELPRQQRARIAVPVLKRAQQIMRDYDPFTGNLITSDMALVTHAWAGEELPDATQRLKDRYPALYNRPLPRAGKAGFTRSYTGSTSCADCLESSPSAWPGSHERVIRAPLANGPGLVILTFARPPAPSVR